VADEIVEYLVAKFSAAEIEAARAAVYASILSEVSESVTITSSSFEGGTASGEIKVGAGSRERFMLQARMALARLNSEATTMSAGLGINWVARRLET
tara:strand:- start:294 stop:584 length:291 start_codon:yes stop_codon:yes gene_type:complete